MILIPATLTIKNKKEKPIFWALTVFTSLLIISIPLGNKGKFPIIVIASALLLAFLLVELLKILKKTLANVSAKRHPSAGGRARCLAKYVNT